ncbi:MAG: hypothetical protein ABJN98_09285 [Roseibium sp.]
MLRSRFQRQKHWRQSLAALLCFSLFAWTTFPAASHTPKFLDTIHDHFQMIEDHGHSHGLDIDILWAMHGHQHDLADHDHNAAVLVKLGRKADHVFERELWRLPPQDATSVIIHPPRRPPRP